MCNSVWLYVYWNETVTDLQTSFTALTCCCSTTIRGLQWPWMRSLDVWRNWTQHYVQWRLEDEYLRRRYVKVSLSSPVSIQTQSLALRTLRKWKPQETQALALASNQSWLPLLRPSIPIGWSLRLLREIFHATNAVSICLLLFWAFPVRANCGRKPTASHQHCQSVVMCTIQVISLQW